MNICLLLLKFDSKLALPSDTDFKAYLFSPMPYSPHSLREHMGDDWYNFSPPTSLESFNPVPHLMALAPWFSELGLCIKAIPACKQLNQRSTKKKGG